MGYQYQNGVVYELPPLPVWPVYLSLKPKSLLTIGPEVQRNMLLQYYIYHCKNRLNVNMSHFRNYIYYFVNMGTAKLQMLPFFV